MPWMLNKEMKQFNPCDRNRWGG